MSEHKRMSYLFVQELVDQLKVNDSSMAALADNLKTHSALHGIWLAHVKSTRDHLVRAENAHSDLVNTLVSSFAKTESVAAKVTNYAKYEVPIRHDVRSARDLVDHYKSTLTFFEDIARVISKRGDILIALLKLDQDAIIAQLKTGQLNYLDARDMRKRWGQVEELVETGQWTQTQL